MPRREVVISQDGRGGGISYVEDGASIPFSWEFAMSPSLAMIWGPARATWDAAYPWAAGRQEAIYTFVGAEVVRQKAAGCRVRFDLEAGTMDILHGAPAEPPDEPRGAPPPASEALLRFLASVPPSWHSWEVGEHYDLKALAELTGGEREEALEALASRETGWREVEALALLDLPGAEPGIRAALTHHLSIDARLAAAEALAPRDRSIDLEATLAREIRRLHRPAEGLDRALRLAALLQSPAIRQALLWASYNGTDCAPRCAELLLQQVAPATSPEERGAILGGLGLHVSSFARDAAFQRLTAALGMELDRSQWE